ncbi:MAG: polysaccharide deacetylase family protein [bacterium]
MVPFPARAMDTGVLRVLTYHRFDTGSWISTPMPAFKQQMEYLMDNNFQFLTIEQVYHHIQSGRSFPEKSVLIMIDDGYNSVFYNAYPFLEKHGIPAVINIYPRAQDENFSAYINWDTVTEMAENPLIHFGNHSYSHHSLLRTGGDTRALRREIVEARRKIRKHTGEYPLTLALTYGNYDREIMAKLNNIDSRPRLIFSTLPGVVNARNSSPPFRRYMIDRHTDMKRFKSILHRGRLRAKPSIADGSHLSVDTDAITFEFARLNRIDTNHLHIFLNGEKLTDHFQSTGEENIWQFSIPGASLSTWNQLMIIGLDKQKRIYRTFSLGFVAAPGNRKKNIQPTPTDQKIMDSSADTSP